MTIGRDTTFTWLGHAAVEVVTPGGKTILFDPWLSNPKSPRTADQQQALDLLLVTHGHGDHMGEAVSLAARFRPAWPCIHEMSLWLGRRLPGGMDQVTGMNKGGTAEIAGLRVTMTGADHSAGDWNPGLETTVYLGEPVGFVVELENGFRIYHAGDTQVFGDMALIRELFRPDLALLPIGGHFTMDPTAAALATELLGVRHVLPIHWGTFPLLAGTPGQLADAIAARGGTAEVHDWKPGDTIS
ncbi:MAG TPA: metal-dependent hydrolase [Candidatus Limnocylindrales bacterium]|nr:metal-dependent hydrolase [Candidatus Limnocylindrales bacterium]